MCGRFAFYNPAQLIDWGIDPELLTNWKARYNIAPDQAVFCLFDQSAGFATWGFSPVWDQNNLALINARAETAAEKPAFRQAMAKTRCVVPANCWYEWHNKKPFKIAVTNQSLVYIAGIYSEKFFGEKAVRTFALLTQNAPPALQPIHHRMPVLLNQVGAKKWLEKLNSSKSGLFQQCCQWHYTFIPLTAKINSGKNEGVACIEPLNKPAAKTPPLF